MAMTTVEQRYQAQTVAALQQAAAALSQISQSLQEIRMTLMRMEQKQRG